MNKNHYALLMAGGIGSRFWPVSTQSYPKQFHDMLGTGETLLQRTFNRLHKIIPAENIYILTNKRYSDLVLEQLPEVKSEQVVLEPAMRNTAPCILYAALKIQKKNNDAVMVVAPSDHWIENESAFLNNLTRCFEAASKKEILMTMGIQPTFPNTGYGYIEYDNTGKDIISKVFKFHEKPTHEKAKAYLEQGNFTWNAGIFVWSTITIINAFRQFQPELFRLFHKGMEVYNTRDEQDFIDKYYGEAENISIDYAILEHSSNIYMLPASFDWNDLGTWGSLYDKLEKDENQNAVVNARVLSDGASRNMIRSSSGKIIVIDGLHDYIVVDKEDVLLIYPKEKEQDIKKVLKNVKDIYGEQYG